MSDFKPKVYTKGFFLFVEVDETLFDLIPDEILCTENNGAFKSLLGNEREIATLKGLGVPLVDADGEEYVFDFIRVILSEEA